MEADHFITFHSPHLDVLDQAFNTFNTTLFLQSFRASIAPTVFYPGLGAGPENTIIYWNFTLLCQGNSLLLEVVNTNNRFQTDPERIYTTPIMNNTASLSNHYLLDTKNSYFKMTSNGSCETVNIYHNIFNLTGKSCIFACDVHYVIVKDHSQGHYG